MQKTCGRGPKGYPARVLLNIFISSYYLNCDSIAATVRALQDNPSLANVCGVIGTVPSRPTLSRFFQRLSQHRELIQRELTRLTDRLADRLPEFGLNVAIDSTTVHTHSNPDKPIISDPDASWTAKQYNPGSQKKRWVFGYKLHLAVDEHYELPVVGYVTTASSPDSDHLLPLVENATAAFPWFHPRSVIADKGYDALINYKCLIDVFQTAPIIPMRAMRRGAKKRRPGTEARTIGVIPRNSKDWKSLYARRTAVERVFGRLKEHRRLERHCYRGPAKITAHCLLSVLTLQAKALAQIETSGELRECLRKVA